MCKFIQADSMAVTFLKTAIGKCDSLHVRTRNLAIVIKFCTCSLQTHSMQKGLNHAPDSIDIKVSASQVIRS